MRWPLALLCLLAASCAGPAHRPVSRTPDLAAVHRQILVTLRIAPAHFRPDTDYAGGYQASSGTEARRRTAQALARRFHLALLDAWPIPALNLDCFVMQVEGATVDPALLRRMSTDPDVVSVQPMHVFRTFASDDPLAALQPANLRWRLAELHRKATGRNVVVAEFDSGVDLAHPDLRGQIGMARNFVDDGAYRAESHGTEVAGIIAAHADNGLGIAGVAPDARLLALRACWQTAASPPGGAICSSFTLAKALQFALQARAQVFNLSLGGPEDPLLAQLLDVALARKVTIVAAIDPHTQDGGFPASHPGVLAVGGPDDRRAGALHAPDLDIPTTMPGARWGFVSGSSFAAAQVSGLAAVLRELSPHAPPAALRASLQRETELASPAQPQR